MEKKIGLTGSLTITVTNSGDSLKSISHTMTYGATLDGNNIFRNSEIEDALMDNTLYERHTAAGVKFSETSSITSTAKYSETKKNFTNTLNRGGSTPVYYMMPKFNNPVYDAETGTMTYQLEGSPMKSARNRLGLGMMNMPKQFVWSESNLSWPENCEGTFRVRVPEGYDGKKLIYPTVTVPDGRKILASPVYPNVSSLSPVFTVMESDGVRLTGGMPVIGSGSNGTVLIHVGNMF